MVINNMQIIHRIIHNISTIILNRFKDITNNHHITTQTLYQISSNLLIQKLNNNLIINLSMV